MKEGGAGRGGVGGRFGIKLMATFWYEAKLNTLIINIVVWIPNNILQRISVFYSVYTYI